jgi:uncharacterized protein (TIGR03086 family)
MERYMLEQGDVSASAADPRDFDRQAAILCLHQVMAVRPDQLGRATPCSDWRLGDLIAHLAAENRGFVAAASGNGDKLAWLPDPADENAGTAYALSLTAALSAFSEDALLERQIEVREFGWHPGRIAIGMHFVDTLAHAWDVARSIGAPNPIPEHLAHVALRSAQLFPTSRPPGGPFAPVIAIEGGRSAADRFLGLVGRSPEWSA